MTQCTDCIKDSYGVIKKVVYLILSTILVSGVVSFASATRASERLSNHILKETEITTYLKANVEQIQSEAANDRALYLSSLKDMQVDIKQLKEIVYRNIGNRPHQ